MESVIPILGKNKIAPAIDKITIILAIERFAIKGLNKTIQPKLELMQVKTV